MSQTAVTTEGTVDDKHAMIVELYRKYQYDHIAAIREASKIQRELSRAEHEVRRIERHMARIETFCAEHDVILEDK